MTVSGSLKKRLGANIRAYRLQENLSQEKLAQKIDLTPRYLAGIERGERNMTLDSVDALAKRLGVESIDLLTGNSEQ